jgi:hypothetical protein
MPGLVPGIHVDPRAEPGDGRGRCCNLIVAALRPAENAGETRVLVLASRIARRRTLRVLSRFPQQ